MVLALHSLRSTEAGLDPAGSQGSSPEIQLSSPSPMSQQARKETQLLKMKLLGWSVSALAYYLTWPGRSLLGPQDKIYDESDI